MLDHKALRSSNEMETKGVIELMVTVMKVFAPLPSSKQVIYADFVKMALILQATMSLSSSLLHNIYHKAEINRIKVIGIHQYAFQSDLHKRENYYKVNSFISDEEDRVVVDNVIRIFCPLIVSIFDLIFDFIDRDHHPRPEITGLSSLKIDSESSKEILMNMQTGNAVVKPIDDDGSVISDTKEIEHSNSIEPEPSSDPMESSTPIGLSISETIDHPEDTRNSSIDGEDHMSKEEEYEQEKKFQRSSDISFGNLNDVEELLSYHQLMSSLFAVALCLSSNLYRLRGEFVSHPCYVDFKEGLKSRGGLIGIILKAIGITWLATPEVHIWGLHLLSGHHSNLCSSSRCFVIKATIKTHMHRLTII
jgi:hypothetical protein